MRHDPLIFLSAGEASGDHYGAELIAALKGVLPSARFTGLGGTLMEMQGQQRVIRAEDVAVMGITEILRHIPRIVASYLKLVRSIKAARPDVAVLIDFPDVNFRLAKHLKRLGVPVIWFVSPQLWAWKRRRLRWVQARVSKMLTIFPFEQVFYANRGVEAEFVGHPLAEQPLPTISREAYAESYGLEPDKVWIALLPGSRRGELRANLPAMVDAAALLGDEYEYLVPVAPTLGNIAPIPHGKLVRDARAALLHSRAAVVASGTATVQAAVIGTPFVVVYRVSKLTFAAAKRLVRYPVEIPAAVDAQGHLPIAMVNLVAGRRVVPELLQERFTAENVVAALRPLLGEEVAGAVALSRENPPMRDGASHEWGTRSGVHPTMSARQEQTEGLAEVRRRLQSPTGQPAIHRLRDAVLTALKLELPTVYAPEASASND